jgi:adenylate cyclase
LVSRLVAGHGGAAIASREAVLTVMFTDIIGFTRMSQHMAPDAVAAMLNAHFEVLGRCIEAEDGTLDKYIGDAVMAFWGAPEDQPDHAARACRAAIAIARAIEAANAVPEHPAIRIKIAIHSGPVVVGNIGAPSRINYTVVGDTVNTCSRIETLCPEFDDGRTAVVLVSQDTAALAGDGFGFVPVGTRAVKGRAEEITVCRLETPVAPAASAPDDPTSRPRD